MQAFPAYRGRGYRSLNAVQACTVSLHCCCRFQGSRRSRRRERCAAPLTLVSNTSRAAPKLRPVDRVFWVLLSRYWSGWKESLALVKPATVVAWHRKGFKIFWRWKSRKHGVGRPGISVEVRRLIVEMAEMKVGWGAPRIQGALLKLGVKISEITVSRYMPKRALSGGSRQRWSTFLRNHLDETLAVDFAVVPTATLGILCVFFVLSRDRRRVQRDAASDCGVDGSAGNRSLSI